MSRLFLAAICPLLLLAACLPLSGHWQGNAPNRAEEPAMRLFVEGIDHFNAEHRSEPFLQLEQNFPDSAWNRRAKTLATLAGSIRLLEKQIKRQQALIEEQQNTQLTLAALTQENEHLQEQVKILKSLIIDLELNQP